MNIITVTGRLTADVEIKQEGKLLVFSIADNEVYYNNKGEKVEEVEYHNCEKWVGPESKIADKLKKAQAVTVYGRQVTNKWTDDNSNKKEKKIIRIEKLELV